MATKKNTISDKILGDIVEAGVRSLLYAKATGMKYGGVARTTLGAARSQAKSMRFLQEEGLLGPVENGSPNYYVPITDKILDYVKAKNPDLVGKLKGHNWNMKRIRSERDECAWRYGIPLLELSIEEAAYVIAHPQEFAFKQFDSRREELVGDFEYGTIPGDRRSFNNLDLVVSDPEYRDFVQTEWFEAKLARLELSNVRWGLQEIVGVSEDDASFIKADLSDGLSLVADSSPRLSDEGDWAEEMRKGIVSTENALAYNSRKLEGLNRVSAAVAKYGGWEKFRDAYRERLAFELRESLKEKEDEANVSH